MQVIFLIAGIISIIYGVYSFKKKKIIVANHLIAIDAINWWKKPLFSLTGNKAKVISLLFVLFGALAIINFVLITFGIVNYP